MFRPVRSRADLIRLRVAVTLFGSFCMAAISPLAAAELPPLPEKISSFGAAVGGDFVYVYGGHTGTPHSHSKENLSTHFCRLNLRSAEKWESLPMGPGLQSPSLVAHGGKLYRVGGLSARNAKGEPDDLVSLATVDCFDPQTNRWTPQTPLPEPRSSHDSVVVGDRLYVVGGWNLGGEQAWHETAWVADLTKSPLEWKPLPKQPFKRRALAAAHHAGRIYAIGGMSETAPSCEVHFFDIASNSWQPGPDVPPMDGPAGSHGGPMNGFGCSAVEANGKLYLSTMDGRVHRLVDDSAEKNAAEKNGAKWSTVGKISVPRYFHRLLTHDGRLLFVAGATRGGHLDMIEQLEPNDLK